MTNVESLGPNASREQGYAWLKTKGGNAQEVYAKYLLVSQKVDGNWLIESDMWNLNK